MIPGLRKLFPVCLIPSKVKKKIISYLLRRYLGQYLKNNSVDIDSLTVELFDGKGEIKHLCFDVGALNGLLEDFPLEITEGFINSVRVAVPWSSLLTESTTVEINGLELSFKPKHVENAAAFLDTISMLSSLSMSSSLQLARECLESEQITKHNKVQDQEIESPFAGVQMFANTIESVLAKIQITLKNTIIRFEEINPETGAGVGLEVKIEWMEYFDDQVSLAEPTVSEAAAASSDTEDWNTLRLPLILTKNFHAKGIVITLDNFNQPRAAEMDSTGLDSLGTSPNMYVSMLSSLHHGQGFDNKEDVDDEEPPVIYPVPIATVVGKSMVKVKIKQKESLDGPKLGIDCHLGAFYFLLSPSQLHSLAQLIMGFAQPSNKSGVYKQKRGVPNRPMDSTDFERVEQELQRHLQAERQRRDGAECLLQEDHMVNLLDDSKGCEMFYSMSPSLKPRQASDMESSVSSINSTDTASTQATSNFPHSESAHAPKRTSARPLRIKAMERRSRIASDPAAEISHYYLKVGLLSGCLLHEDPSIQGQETKEDRMRILASEFFNVVRGINFIGHNLSLREIRDKISSALLLDHLGLLGKPLSMECLERTLHRSQSYSLDFILHSAELIECLFDRQEKNSTSMSFTDLNKLPQYSELLIFPSQDGREQTPYELTATSAAKILAAKTPSAQVHISIVSKTGGYGYASSEAKICVELSPISTELDITILDRLTGLLYPSIYHAATQSGVFAQTSSSNLGPQFFDQALEESSTNLDISLSCPRASLRIRFPIPDLRTGVQYVPREWWRRNLRKEILLAEIQKPRLHTRPTDNGCIAYELVCSEIEAYMQDDFGKPPLLFGCVTGDESCDAQEAEEGFNWPKLVVKVFPSKTCALESGELSDGSNSDSLNGAMQFEKVAPSPFSSQKNMVHKEHLTPDSKDEKNSIITEEKVMPGDKREMQNFQDAASANTQLLVEITVPVVLAQFHDKPFFELLYNRVNNDLLMWEPQAPAPTFNPEIIPSSMGVNLSVQQHLLNLNSRDGAEMFETAYYDSDSDTDESSTQYSIHDSKRGRASAQRQLQSKVCLSLNIGQGKLLCCVPLKEEKFHGELLAVVNDAALYSVTTYGGDPDLRYLCFSANRAHLYHSGCVEQPVIPGKLDAISDHSPSHLGSRIYRCERGVQISKCLKNSFGTGTDNSQDMISIAVRTKLDTLTNVKEFVVSACARGATLRHEMAEPGESWISQAIEFLDVKDYPIIGYTMPTIMTALHLHLLGCSIDYRPRKLPLRAMVTAENCTLSTNISAETPTTTLRFLLEDAALFLSDTSYLETNLQRDFVQVAYLSLFELALRLGEESKNQNQPKTDLCVVANKLEVRTCSDSCKALIDLLNYFASKGDLNTSLAEETDSQSSQSGEASQERKRSEDSISGAQLEQIHFLMDEVLQEANTLPSESNEAPKVGKKTEVFFRTQEDFISSPVLAPRAGLRQIIVSPTSDSDCMEDGIDDDDFCIIDDPGMGIAPRDGEPVVRIFTKEPVLIIDDFFKRPTAKYDPMKAPSHFPQPEARYTLKELSLIWYIYGGKDFGSGERKRCEHASKERPIPLIVHGSPSHSPDGRKKEQRTWQEEGGSSREHNTCIEFHLSKISMQHEVYPSHTAEASFTSFVVHEVKALDRLANSDVNQILYLYVSEERPRQTSASMVVVKWSFTRPDPTLPMQECSLFISLQPVRLNIDQESLFFLRQFIMESLGQQPSDPYSPTSGMEKYHRSSTPTQSPSNSSGGGWEPVFRMEGYEEEGDGGRRVPQELLIQLDELSLEHSQALKAALEQGDNGTDVSSIYDDDNAPVFFRSVIFTPACPIRMDYSGKCIRMDISTLASLLAGFAQLRDSELCLRPICCKHGLLGIDKVLAYLANEWLMDIRTRQLPNILGGLGSINTFVQLTKGIRDMFWMPVEQYRRDGRVWRGIQRGASSLTVSTARAIIEISNKAVGLIQYLSELAFDMLSPGPSVRQTRKKSKRRSRRSQPTDLREGMANAYQIVSEGITDTARTLARAATEEHELKGVTGVVGGVLRQIPPTAVKPIIIATSATSNILGGMRNQLCPSALQEDEHKWKSND